MVQQRGQITVHMQNILPDQGAIAIANFPAILHQTMGQAFAARAAAESENLAAQKGAAAMDMRELVRRLRRAPSNRMVSCGSHSSQPPVPTSRLFSIWLSGPSERYIFFVCRLADHHRPGLLAKLDGGLQTVTIDKSAGNAGDHGLKHIPVRFQREQKTQGLAMKKIAQDGLSAAIHGQFQLCNAFPEQSVMEGTRAERGSFTTVILPTSVIIFLGCIRRQRRRRYDDNQSNWRVIVAWPGRKPHSMQADLLNNCPTCFQSDQFRRTFPAQHVANTGLCTVGINFAL